MLYWFDGCAWICSEWYKEIAAATFSSRQPSFGNAMGRFAKMQLIIVGIFGFLNVSVMLFICIVMFEWLPLKPHNIINWLTVGQQIHVIDRQISQQVIYLQFGNTGWQIIANTGRKQITIIVIPIFIWFFNSNGTGFGVEMLLLEFNVLSTWLYAIIILTNMYSLLTQPTNHYLLAANRSTAGLKKLLFTPFVTHDCQWVYIPAAC